MLKAGAIKPGSLRYFLSRARSHSMLPLLYLAAVGVLTIDAGETPPVRAARARSSSV